MYSDEKIFLNAIERLCNQFKEKNADTDENKLFALKQLSILINGLSEYYEEKIAKEDAEENEA